MKLLSDQVDNKEINTVLECLQKTLQSGIDGDVAEFGCYVGTTSVWIAKCLEGTKKSFYVYDSFSGLPLKTCQDESPLGIEFKEGELLATKKQFIANIKKAKVPMPIIKKAWFDQLAETDIPTKICFAFLDGDYYQSIKKSLKLIEKNIVKYGIVIIDDYDNSALPGAQKAVDEWIHGKKVDKVIKNSLAILKIKY
jgi:O-methyltransferase